MRETNLKIHTKKKKSHLSLQLRQDSSGQLDIDHQQKRETHCPHAKRVEALIIHESLSPLPFPGRWPKNLADTMLGYYSPRLPPAPPYRILIHRSPVHRGKVQLAILTSRPIMKKCFILNHRKDWKLLKRNYDVEGMMSGRLGSSYAKKRTDCMKSS